MSFGKTIALGSLSIIAIALGVMAADRDPPFVRRSGYTMPQAVKVGERAEVYWDADRTRDCRGVITRWMVDWKGDIWTLPMSFARYSHKVSGPLSDFWVPAGAACRQMKGFNGLRAKYIARAEYACPFNLVHKFFPIVVDTPDIEFDIDC